MVSLFTGYVGHYKTINFTLGARYDQYNDFGGNMSPRAGLTWAFMKDASLKFLYGEAFHAPSFLEMFTTNQPAIKGNPDLNPETIKTYEVGLNYKFNKYVTSSINYFNNDIKDLIGLRMIDPRTKYYILRQRWRCTCSGHRDGDQSEYQQRELYLYELYIPESGR